MNPLAARDAPMRFAYADPPYLGMGKMYLSRHPEAMIWNDPETHRALIERLCVEYPDGWALSASSTNLRVLLPMCPDDVRVMAWCKTWAKFLPGISPAYAWEPVLLRGGRPVGKKDYYTTDENTARDWHQGNHPPRVNKPEGFVPGMKPREFCRWLFRCLNARPTDTLDDLFPGSGAVSAAWSDWCGGRSPLPRLPLEIAGEDEITRSPPEPLPLSRVGRAAGGARPVLAESLGDTGAGRDDAGVGA